MKVLHLIRGGDKGGAKTHLFTLLDELKKYIDCKVVCLIPGVFYQEILEKDIETVLIEQKNRFDLSVVKKIEKLIEDDKVVFISEDIIAELQDDLDQEFQKISEETGELIWVICKDSLEMLYYIQNGMTDGDTENSVAERITTVRVCIACRRLLHKSVSEIKNLAIFRRYRKLEAECAKLMEENRRLEAEQARLMKSLASDY